jgi:hypothetical protein
MSLALVPQFVREHYEVREWRHAVAILSADFSAEWADIVSVRMGRAVLRDEDCGRRYCLRITNAQS